MQKVFSIFFPEIFVLFSLITTLFLLTFISQRNTEETDENSTKPNTVKISWFICLLSSIIYSALLYYIPAKNFQTSWGISSNETTYSLRFILSLCFIVYFIYLYTELKSFVFYTYEFFIVLLVSFITLNMLLLSNSFLNFFLFIEFLNFTIYYLLASQKTYSRSIECTIKYFIMSSVLSAFLVFGFFLIYYCTGCSTLPDLYLMTINNTKLLTRPIFLVACLVVSFSFLSKIGSSFFYFWIIDVYDGTSYSMLIYLNTFFKITYVYVLFRFLESFNSLFLSNVIKIILIFSLIFGALGALYQSKVRRFLIFTSLYNISFFTLTIWNFDLAFSGLLIFFVFFYLFNNLIFLILFLSLRDWTSELCIRSLLDLASLKNQNSTLAYCAAFYSFLVAGLPIGSLFLAKLSIFFEVSQQLDFTFLALFLFFSTFAFIYYVRLVRLLLFSDKNNSSVLFQPLSQITAFLLGFGVYLNLLMFILYDKFILLFTYLTI